MKKQTKRIIVGSVILLVLGVGSGITYFIVNQGSGNNSAKQETSSEYATVTDVAQADADIESESTDNASDNSKDENTTEISDKPNGSGKTTAEETTNNSNPTTENKPTTTQAPKPQANNNQQATTEERTTEDRPTTEERTTERPTTEERTTERPTTEESTTERPTTEATPTTEAATECSHDWVTYYTTVHHDAITHTEEQEVCVKAAWTEEIYAWQEWCCHCKLNFTKAGYTDDEMTLHLVNCADGKGSSWMVEYLLWDTIEHPAEYEMQTVTVVDKEAWDEKIVDYYICRNCERLKLPDSQ